MYKKTKRYDREILSLMTRIDRGYLATKQELKILNAHETLNIRSCKATEFPHSCNKLGALQHLNISNNSIKSIPDEIGDISSLQVIIASNNPLKKLPESMGKLNWLEQLYICGTEIEELPPFIANLERLEVLDISNTSITSLPDWIGELPNLRSLNISNLRLNRIPKTVAIKYYYHHFPDSKKTRGLGLTLFGTTLSEQKVSVFLQTPELIPNLYEEQVTLRESKIIFLGDGDSGKSYTIQRFLHEGVKEPQNNPYTTRETPGVEIEDYHVDRGSDSFDIHFWDFGGQQLLHSMHRCFLTEQTCYIITVKSRETKATQRARYWLRNVTAFAPDSPIMLFVNCWENDNGLRTIDENELRKDYPMIKNVVYCSAKESETKEFREIIMDGLINLAADSDGCKQTVNRRWNEVRLAILGENKNFLTKERYHELCQLNGIENENAPSLLTFFNNLGVCFSYHRDKNKNELAEYKLLNPVWLTNALYAIIEEGMAGAQEGRINVKSIEQMLENNAPDIVNGHSYRRTMPTITYTKEQCQYIIDVAAAHNLCYRIGPNMLFFPALCSNNTPKDTWVDIAAFPQHMEYQLKYKYLPDSVVHQLMIHCLKKDLVINSCWLRGMILGGMNTHKAIIRMDDDDETLKIDIYTREKFPPYYFFSLIKKELAAINESLNLKATDYIVDGEDRHTLISLLSAAKDHGYVYGQQSGKKRKAEDLIGFFYFDWTAKTMQVENGQIIISIPHRQYNKHDKKDPILRQALYEAYNGLCPYCKKTLENVRDIEVDHILPAKYKPKPALEDYINYLTQCGFDIEHPDYIENYFPSHPSCNVDKLNDVDEYSLPSRHELAFKRTKRVLSLMKKIKENYESSVDKPSSD